MNRQDHDRLLTCIGEYLAFTPDAVQSKDVHALTANGLDADKAYLTLLTARCARHADPTVAQLCCTWLPLITRRHDPVCYEADPYFQAVKPMIGTHGTVDLVYEQLEPMELFIADDFSECAAGLMLPRLGWFDRIFSFPALREDGRVWMSITPNEINTLQPAVQESHGKVLTYGLGMGYYAFHCLLKKEVDSVTVVEANPAVIDAFTQCLLPFFPRKEALHIIQADAFDYAANIMPQEGYDTVFTDLWRDVADGIPLYQRMKAMEIPGPRYLYWIERMLTYYME